MFQPRNGISITDKPTEGGLAVPPKGARALPHYQNPGPPQPDLEIGSLFVAESVVLTAQKFNLRLDFIYNEALSTEFGGPWSINLRQFVSSTVGGTGVTVNRGDGSSYNFSLAGASGGISTYAATDGALSTLAFDGTKFTESYPDGHRLVYQSQQPASNPVTHQLISSADSTGSIQTLTYGSVVGAPANHPYLLSVEIPGGQLATFGYVLHPHQPIPSFSTLTDWASRTWTMAFTTFTGNVSFQSPSGCLTQYGYGAFGMTSHQDPMGFSSSFSYGSTTGQPTAVSAGGANWTYTWMTSQNVAQMPSGALLTYNFDPTSGLLSSIQHVEGYTRTLSYNPDGVRVQEVTPAGTVLSQIYDTRTKLIASQSDGMGNTAFAQYDALSNLTTLIAPNAQVLSFGYLPGSSSHNPVSVIDADAVSSSYTYFSSGLMQSATDGRGLRTSFVWDLSGNLVSTQNPDGGLSTNVYDSLNRLVAAQDELGRTTSYVLDQVDNIIATVQPNGAITTNLYLTCLVQATINALGGRTSYTYDRFKNVLTSVNAAGATWTNAFDTMGFPVSRMDPMGNVATLVYNNAKQLVATVDQVGNRTSLIFDKAARQIATQDPAGNLATQILDVQGRQVATISPIGARATNLFSPAGISAPGIGIVTIVCPNTYTFAPLGIEIAAANQAVLTGRVDPLSNISTLVLSPAGRTIAQVNAVGARTSYGFDSAGNQVSTQDPLNNLSTVVYSATSGRKVADVNALSFATSYAWDLAGQLSATQNSRGFLASLSYDLNGRNVASMNALNQVTTTNFDLLGQPISRQTAMGFLATTVYDLAQRPIASIDALSFVNTTNFDLANRRVSTQDPLNNFTTLIYDQASRVVASVDALSNVASTFYDQNSRVLSTQDPRGAFSTNGFDPAGRLVQTVNAVGAANTTVYDLADRQIAQLDALNRTWTAVFNTLNLQIASIDPAGAASSTVYDLASRAVASINPLGFANTVVYDQINRVVANINPLGFPTSYGFDPNNNRVQVQDANGGGATNIFDALDRVQETRDPLNFRKLFAFDADSRPTKLTDEDNGVITMTYSARSEMLSRADQMGNLTTWTFDGAGRNSTRQFASGDVTSYGFDPNGRRVSILYQDGSRSTFGFDPNGNKILASGFGIGATTMAYDAVNRLVGKTDPGNLSQSYSFDLANQRIKSVDPDGGVRTVTFDPVGRPNFLAMPGFSVTTIYDLASRVVSEVFQSGVTRNTVYDGADQIFRRITQNSAGTVLGRWTFTYDPVGNRNVVRDIKGNLTQYFNDLKNRLRKDASNGPNAHVFDYGYNSVSDRVTSDETGALATSTFDRASRIQTTLSTLGFSTFTFSPNGNMILVNEAAGLTTMAYDFENRLSVHQNGANVASYLYYTDNMKAVETVNGTSTTLVWDGGDYVGEVS